MSSFPFKRNFPFYRSFWNTQKLFYEKDIMAFDIPFSINLRCIRCHNQYLIWRKIFITFILCNILPCVLIQPKNWMIQSGKGGAWALFVDNVLITKMGFSLKLTMMIGSVCNEIGLPYHSIYIERDRIQLLLISHWFSESHNRVLKCLSVCVIDGPL